MPMKLADLLRDVMELTPPLAELEVSGVQEDSRRVSPGDLFVAIRGLTLDGHDFVPAAVGAGAVAVVAERPVEAGVPCLVVGDASRALALAAARLEGEPALGLQIIGLTGTNGKTTTTYLMEAILAEAGHRPAVIGTVSYRFAGQSEAAPYTTPTSPVLQQLLRRVADSGCTHVVMEVSSHALELGRVWGLPFAVAGFTHLTQDHLDLHGSMEAYLQAKLRLFSRHLRSGGTAVVNVDGDGAEAVLEAVRQRGELQLITCSTSGRPATARLEALRHSVEGIAATLHLGDRAVALRSRLLGAYNADNVLLAAACCYAAGVDGETIARGVNRVEGVPGRLERVTPPGSDFAVLVDYAHTPDALTRAMGVLRPLCRGRLLVVFGCGGDRDRSKRPLMGQAVARDADLAVVTSDNPRTESPQAIIAAIVEGVRREAIPAVSDPRAPRGFIVEPDRRRAIGLAVRAASPGDIVLVAGKGHEDYQILGRTRIHFDDREEARAALEAR